jgi:hypothetical protein
MSDPLSSQNLPKVFPLQLIAWLRRDDWRCFSFRGWNQEEGKYSTRWWHENNSKLVSLM